MTLLNCGYEKGEVIEMDGELVKVVGETVNDAYLPEDQQEWYPEVEPVST